MNQSEFDSFMFETAETNPTGTVITFTFLVSVNPTLTDYKVRSALLAFATTHYPKCVSGTITDPKSTGIVTARFVRDNSKD